MSCFAFKKVEAFSMCLCGFWYWITKTENTQSSDEASWFRKSFFESFSICLQCHGVPRSIVCFNYRKKMLFFSFQPHQKQQDREKFVFNCRKSFVRWINFWYFLWFVLIKLFFHFNFPRFQPSLTPNVWKFNEEESLRKRQSDWRHRLTPLSLVVKVKPG